MTSTTAPNKRPSRTPRIFTRRAFLKSSLGLAGLMAAPALLMTGCSSSQTSQAAAATTDSGAKLNVSANFYPMYDFTSKVGGDHVNVTCLVPAGTEPHDWEPSSTDVANITKSDLLVYNGASMEHWIDNVTNAAGGSLKTCEASKGLQLRAGEAEEGEQTDGPVYDPHVWLAPENAKAEMANIKDALSEIDPRQRKRLREQLRPVCHPVRRA